MAYSICKIKNISGEVKQLHEKEFDIDEIFTITDDKRHSWAYNDDVIKALSDEYFEIHNSIEAISGLAEQLRWLQNSIPVDVEVTDRVEARTVNCKLGRKLHNRYITFTTSDQDNYDNTNWKDEDFGDLTYIMKDVNGDTTTVEADCKETWLDWEPSFDYEIFGGGIFVPAELDGSNDDAWEVHVVAVPDIPTAYGGSIDFIANPRIKWVKGTWLTVCSANNPAELLYDATYHTNKIRFVVKHPVGAQTEFQLNLGLYK
jgi:hypothetical protein